MVWHALSAEELENNFRNRVPDLIGPVQVLVSVPKKKRRKAVDRVLMRRRMREAFRLNRAELVRAVADLEQVRTLGVGLVYLKEANAPYAEIEEKMKKLLAKLIVKLQEKYPSAEENDPQTADTSD